MVTNCGRFQIPLPKDSSAPLCQKSMVDLSCNMVESFSMARIPSGILARNTMRNEKEGLFVWIQGYIFLRARKMQDTTIEIY